jgi:hypothetical protein
MNKCIYCGNWHEGLCSRIAEIEYYEGGGIKRVRLRDWENLPLPQVVPGAVPAGAKDVQWK